MRNGIQPPQFDMTARSFPLSPIREHECRFYVNPPPYNHDRSKEPIARLLGNKVVMERRMMDNFKTRGGGIVVPDIYNNGTNIFRVMAVGEGAFVRIKKKLVWLEPECEPGDIVISNHWANASYHTAWSQPVYLDDAGGAGRVVLDSRFIECIISSKL